MQFLANNKFINKEYKTRNKENSNNNNKNITINISINIDKITKYNNTEKQEYIRSRLPLCRYP
jgi:uncharacterized protein YueI